MKLVTKALTLSILFLFISTSTMGVEPSKGKEQLKPTPENLLKIYNKKVAVRTREIIEKCKAKDNHSPKAMKLVAQSIFLMYGLDKKYIGKVSYAEKSTKAVKHTKKGKIKRIDIYVGKRKNPKLKHVDKAFGNDTFLHEMLHALNWIWVEQYGDIALVSHGKDNPKAKKRFEECRQLLVDAIYKTKLEKKKNRR